MKIFQNMWESILKDSLDNDLSGMDQDIQENLEMVKEKLPKLTLETADKAADLIRQKLLRTASEMLKEHAELKESFENRLNMRWGKAFDLLEQLIAVAHEAGEEFNREFRPEAVKDNDLVFEVLTQLHARSCQVASEVLTLLESGYADGAMARWRSLQEITVTALFIRGNGQDLAEKYLLHENIESYKGARQYQNYVTRLGYPPYSEEELDQFKKRKDELIGRFGSDYNNNYGWAAQALNKAKPKFSDIEKKVELDHLRPFYKMASHNVHANPKGITFKLGLHDNTHVLLTGPSNYGLSDPGICTAISLSQITINLLTRKATLDHLIICRVISKILDECEDAFLEASHTLDEDISNDA
ncbi:MAG: DUF5677 domain-containing protein [Thermoleophilia bacterium]